MVSYLYYDGEVIGSQDKLVTADNRGLRYGDGLFETIKVIDGRIVLADLHFNRLFSGLALLQFDIPALFKPHYLSEAIIQLCKKNKVEKAARVRLTVIRGNGGLYDPEDHRPHLIIQAWPIQEQVLHFNGQGLVIDLYPEARKSCDALSNLKSNNYLPYVMAALYAKQYRLNDCLLLNTHDRICDATIANICWVHSNTIFTPPLSEGCVSGVMRQYLLEEVVESDHWSGMVEQVLTVDELLQAEEVFLTNAQYGIRWVSSFRDKTYGHRTSSLLYDRYVRQLNE